MLSHYKSYEIDTDLSRIDLDRVQAWLASSYWSQGVSREKVERAAQGSSDVIGVYDGARQVAYCRIISDKETFAWLCDVYVDADFRGQGIAKAMVRFALNLPYAEDLRRWVLATRDAHAIYAQCGFRPLENSGGWMVVQPERSTSQAEVGASPANLT